MKKVAKTSKSFIKSISAMRERVVKIKGNSIFPREGTLLEPLDFVKQPNQKESK